MALRNENMELNQRLAAYEQSEAALSAALVKAEHTASEIISAARERAEGIISEARDEEKRPKSASRNIRCCSRIWQSAAITS